MKHLLLAAGLLASAPALAQHISGTRVYYNDTSGVDDGEIWGSNLPLFFTETSGVTIYTSKSQGLAAELKKVKKLLAQQSIDLSIDYQPYTYVFITNLRDTLYASKNLTVWRYKNKRLTARKALVSFNTTQ